MSSQILRPLNIRSLHSIETSKPGTRLRTPEEGKPETGIILAASTSYTRQIRYPYFIYFEIILKEINNLGDEGIQERTILEWKLRSAIGLLGCGLFSSDSRRKQCRGSTTRSLTLQSVCQFALRLLCLQFRTYTTPKFTNF